MPTTKTAEKEMRVAERRKARNKSIRSQTKTNVSKAEEVISSGNLDAAKAEVKAPSAPWIKRPKKVKSIAIIPLAANPD